MTSLGLEDDLINSAEIKSKIRASSSVAEKWYSALCNNTFYRTDNTFQQWSCSWRYSAKIIAEIYRNGDYLDWFLSGDEGVVAPEDRDDLFALGWSVMEEFKPDSSWSKAIADIMRHGISLPPIQFGEFRIGLIGGAGSGKDTMASILREMYPSIRPFAFADDLKLMTAKMLNSGFHANGITLSYPEFYVEDINEYRDELRGLWQWFGTDIIRNKLPYYWINRVAIKIKNSKSSGRFIVTDCRFENERNWLKDNGFILIKVTGRTRENTPVHASETELLSLDADFVYENIETIEDMKNWVRETIAPILDKMSARVDTSIGVLP